MLWVILYNVNNNSISINLNSIKMKNEKIKNENLLLHPESRMEKWKHNECGSRGPLYCRIFILHEKMASFNRREFGKSCSERFRVPVLSTVYKWYFKYTKAKIFSKIGKQTKFFSDSAVEVKEEADAEKGSQRFYKMKFYTDGNWDLVGNNTPVFFIRDPKNSLTSFTRKTWSRTNCKARLMCGITGVSIGESKSNSLILMSDRGNSYSYQSIWTVMVAIHISILNTKEWNGFG